MEKIELKLDEANELLFKVVIEGTREPASAIRFVCEGEEFSYMFKGTTGDEPGEVRVIVPPMQDKLKEGLYEGRLEVLIEGKYLAPLQCLAQFKPGVKVVAESVQVAPQATKHEIKATASVSVKARPVPAKPVEQSTPVAPIVEATKPVQKFQTLAEKFGRTKH